MISIPVDIFQIIKPIFAGTDFSSDDLIFKCLYGQNRPQNKPGIECNFLDPLSQICICFVGEML